MTNFMPHGKLEAETQTEREWLLGELERLYAEKELTEAICWEIEIGRRETATPDGRALAQTGFRIRARAGDGDVDASLACFVPLGDLSDEESRESAALVLSLWIDRLT